MVPLAGLRCVIVVFPDHTHCLFCQRSRFSGIMCVIIYLDAGVHDYVLMTTISGAKMLSVKNINPTC